jgi:hypothetical protein
MAKIIGYYVDANGNYYVNANQEPYITGYEFTPETAFTYKYLRYTPYIYSNGSYKKYVPVIRKADGSYVKCKSNIYTYVDLSIAGIAIAGQSYAN